MMLYIYFSPGSSVLLSINALKICAYRTASWEKIWECELSTQSSSSLSSIGHTFGVNFCKSGEYFAVNALDTVFVLKTLTGEEVIKKSYRDICKKHNIRNVLISPTGDSFIILREDAIDICNFGGICVRSFELSENKTVMKSKVEICMWLNGFSFVQLRDNGWKFLFRMTSNERVIKKLYKYFVIDLQTGKTEMLNIKGDNYDCYDIYASVDGSRYAFFDNNNRRLLISNSISDYNAKQIVKCNFSSSVSPNLKYLCNRCDGSDILDIISLNTNSIIFSIRPKTVYRVSSWNVSIRMRGGGMLRNHIFYSVNFSNNGALLSVIENNNYATIYETATGRILNCINKLPLPVRRMRLSYGWVLSWEDGNLRKEEYDESRDAGLTVDSVNVHEFIDDGVGVGDDAFLWAEVYCEDDEPKYIIAGRRSGATTLHDLNTLALIRRL